MRIAVLWTGLSGYLNSCLKELASREAVELFVSHQIAVQDAPFDDRQFSWMRNRLVWKSRADFTPLALRMKVFAPQMLLICGWYVPAYRRIAKQLANCCPRIMATDNSWNATFRQKIGALIAPWYIQPLADAIWVPEERQAIFAMKMGFEQCTILRGVYSCDQPAIDKVYQARLAEGRSLPRAFLFVGRFVSEKGIHQLASAYQSYRERTEDPWPLVCCGSGPLARCLEGKPGIRVEGFVQPELLLEKFASAGCLILPSTFEPWAVVVHEATSAGLLVLASENAGAAAHLVQNNRNGYIFDPNNIEELSMLMSQVSGLSQERCESMSKASHILSQQFTPSRWADTLIQAHETISAHL
jgi:glycosyltransferase involved in cell wall biosynthesis